MTMQGCVRRFWRVNLMASQSCYRKFLLMDMTFYHFHKVLAVCGKQGMRKTRIGRCLWFRTKWEILKSSNVPGTEKTEALVWYPSGWILLAVPGKYTIDSMGGRSCCYSVEANKLIIRKPSGTWIHPRGAHFHPFIPFLWSLDLPSTKVHHNFHLRGSPSHSYPISIENYHLHHPFISLGSSLCQSFSKLMRYHVEISTQIAAMTGSNRDARRAFIYGINK